jgi:hypothetical protein
MLKRARWIGVGVAVGVGASVWTQKKVKAVTDRYRPGGLAEGAANRVKGIPGEVRAALSEGRAAMREREAELRAANSQSVRSGP